MQVVGVYQVYQVVAIPKVPVLGPGTGSSSVKATMIKPILSKKDKSKEVNFSLFNKIGFNTGAVTELELVLGPKTGTFGNAATAC